MVGRLTTLTLDPLGGGGTEQHHLSSDHSDMIELSTAIASAAQSSE
jgi:hypothetical protein